MKLQTRNTKPTHDTLRTTSGECETMTEYMYRYRSAKATLADFNELEKSTIFFPELRELNDPLEGFHDIYWQGDEVVWESLLQHYTYVLMLRCVEHFGQIGDEFVHSYEILAQNTPLDIGEPNLTELFEVVSKAFLDDAVVTKIVKILAKKQHKLRRDALIQIIGLLQPILLFHIITQFRDGDYSNRIFGESTTISVEPYEQIASVSRDKLTRYIEHDRLIDAPYGIFAISINQLEQLQLLKESNMPDGDLDQKWQRLVMHFPSKYVSSLEASTYSKWYTACFSTDATNSSMCGMYADCHKGVCLKFKTTKHPSGVLGLNLNSVNSWGGGPNGETVAYRNFNFHQLYKVDYKNPYPASNFFLSLGGLTMPRLVEFWYRGRDGKLSDIGIPLLRSDDPTYKGTWRHDYWKTFAKSATCKTADWSHEKEYRIVLKSMVNPNIPKEHRTLQYKFEDLHGVVFGLNTPSSDKITIMNIVYRKCKELGRTDFEFQQVRYDSVAHQFKLFPLEWLSLPKPGNPFALAPQTKTENPM